jgi:hypothetical protein
MKKLSGLFLILLVVLGLSLSQAQDLPSIQCGDIVEGELTGQPTEENRIFNEYTLQVQAGTVIDLLVTPLGQSFNTAIKMFDSGGTEFATFNLVAAGEPEEILEYSIGSSNPVLRIYGIKPEWIGTDYFNNSARAAAGFYLGAYEVSLACTLRDGTRVDFGEQGNNGENASTDNMAGIQERMGMQDCSFCFPGVLPVDFSTGIEIPLTLGQAQTIPIGNDVALYTYEATAGSTATLSVSRVSGNISIGVTVINRSTNEIIFVAGLPSTNSLSAEIVFPTDGSYVIGLFRFDTPTLTSSSGAVQVLLQ